MEWKKFPDEKPNTDCALLLTMEDPVDLYRYTLVFPAWYDKEVGFFFWRENAEKESVEKNQKAKATHWMFYPKPASGN